MLGGNCDEELTVVQPRAHFAGSRPALRSDQFPTYAVAGKSALELGSHSSVPKSFSAPWADSVENRGPDTLLTRATRESLEPRSEDGKESASESAKNHDLIKFLKFVEQRRKQALDELEQHVARENEARFWPGQAEAQAAQQEVQSRTHLEEAARFPQDQAAQQEIQSRMHFEGAARFPQDQAARQEIQSRTHLAEAAGKGQKEAKAVPMLQEICDAEAKRAAGASQAVVAGLNESLKRLDESLKQMGEKGNVGHERALGIHAFHDSKAAEGKEILQTEVTHLDPSGSESSRFANLNTQTRSVVFNSLYDRLSVPSPAKEEADVAQRKARKVGSVKYLEPLD